MNVSRQVPIQLKVVHWLCSLILQVPIQLCPLVIIMLCSDLTGTNPALSTGYHNVVFSDLTGTNPALSTGYHHVVSSDLTGTNPALSTGYHHVVFI